MDRYFIAFYQILTIVCSLGLVFFISRTAIVSVKEKRPGMDCLDSVVYTVFLGLFVCAVCLLIKCGIADPIRALFF